MMKKVLVWGRKWIYFRTLAVTLAVSMILTGMPLDGIMGFFTRAQALSSNTAEATVVEEVTSLRDEYSKTYLMSDGTYRAVATALPLHFLEKDKDGDENWEDIDNSLTLVTGEDGQKEYQNTKAPFIARLPEKLGEGRAVSLSKDGFTLSMEMLEVQQKTAQKQAAEQYDSKSLLKSVNEKAKSAGVS